ncbi:MAG: glutaredoxin 3 [Gammaproteobacteria bacterium]|nr:glutaredoxin 3 [Gammaproteobacteria bacterium]
MNTKVIIYTKANCPYCDWAKQLLDHKNLSYQEFRVDLDSNKREEMERLSGRRSCPQIFINDQAIGGFDDLSALAKSGELDRLIQLHKS